MRGRRRRLGQHFLRDRTVARDIAAALPGAPERVVEIGAGLGALTMPLLERFERVQAIELDENLALGLAARLGHPVGLDVVHGDALTLDLDDLAGDGPWLLAGNLPYSVATPLLRRLVLRHDLFPTLVVMVQLEVAQRLVAQPGVKSWGLLSLEVQARAGGQLLFRVPPGCFAPRPRVDSAVVRLDLQPPPVPQEVLARALKLAALAFTHRRKKLTTTLGPLGGRDRVAAALAGLGLEAGARPEVLPLSSWIALAAQLDAETSASGAVQ